MVTPGHSGLLLFAQSHEQALVGLLAPPWEPSELSAGSVSLLLGLPIWEDRQGPVFCGSLNGGFSSIKIPGELVLLPAYDAQRSQANYSLMEGTAEISFNTGAPGAGLIEETSNIPAAQRGGTFFSCSE